MGTAAAVGVTLGLVHMVWAPDDVLATAILVFVLGVDLVFRYGSPPGSLWRVPRRQFLGGSCGTAAVFGVALGSGLATVVGSYGVWALLLVGWLADDLALSAVSWMAFGFGRALPAIYSSWRYSPQRADQGAWEFVVNRPAFDAVELAGLAALVVVLS